MNCTEFEALLADYIDGALTPKERASVEEHAASCESCREFMAEAMDGLSVLEGAEEIEPPAELITRIAYLVPQGKVRDPFEQPGAMSRFIQRWLMPVLQPRLAMGMAMTILSFAMLKRCTGVEVHELQPADLSPVRIWSNVEDKALRVKDQTVKYYENLRIVYEIETHMKDLEAAQSAPEPEQKQPAKADDSAKGKRP